MAFSTLYARFRGSKAFVYSLATFVSVWLLGHFTFGIDPTFGALNLTLSIEASLSVALLIMHNEKMEKIRARDFLKAEEQRRKDMKYMLDMTLAMKTLLEENAIIIKSLVNLEQQGSSNRKKIKVLGEPYASSSIEKDCKESPQTPKKD